MDLKEEVSKYLQSQKLMSILTTGEELWPAIVYYICDDDLNLYFLSKPSDQHCINIEKNPEVAITIFDSAQTLDSDKVGIQANGIATKVNSLSKIKWMLALWNKLIVDSNDTKINFSDFVKAQKSAIYVVKLKKVKYYNEGLFEKKFEILEL